jgi:bis(5'-nucleosyl)-tetraphosphatase (symmetrical)
VATYAVGDLQGCYRELVDLLGAIRFKPGTDTLWFTGDLVNRGPESLECLRFVRDLGDRAIVVLGNHDLHLLAIAAGARKPRKKDTLDKILRAPDRGELLDWLARRPLIHRDTRLGFTLVHAGLPPQWDIPAAQRAATELETALRGRLAEDFYANMYGNDPDRWSEGFEGWARLRFFTNCFTRMRYCDPEGRLDLEMTGPPGSQPPPWLPWYEVPDRRSRSERILFGHWSTVRLDATVDFSRWKVYPLDTGCVWGGSLTALRLDDQKQFNVPSRQKKHVDGGQ